MFQTGFLLVYRFHFSAVDRVLEFFFASDELLESLRLLESIFVLQLNLPQLLCIRRVALTMDLQRFLSPEFETMKLCWLLLRRVGRRSWRSGTLDKIGARVVFFRTSKYAVALVCSPVDHGGQSEFIRVKAVDQ